MTCCAWGARCAVLKRSSRRWSRFPLPAAISTPTPAVFAQHGARFARPLDALPANVRVVDDDGSDDSMIRIESGARLIVLPALKAASLLPALAPRLAQLILGKCVIGSEGPGMSDIFTDEVLMAPPEDSAALARVIKRAWEDDRLRRGTAAAGLSYAREAGGEPELYQRIIDQVAAWSAAGLKLSTSSGG